MTAVSAAAPVRRELLLETLRKSGEPRSIASLAQELDVHANTVRFHLEALLHSGSVEQVVGEPAGPGRPPILFRATRRMDPSGPTNYRLLARILTNRLATTSSDPVAAAIEIGREWGPHLLDLTSAKRSGSSRIGRGEALARMTCALAEVGFAPEPPTGPRDTTIRLRHCPFLELVVGSHDAGDPVPSSDGCGALICRMHLGLMQGAFAALDGPVTVERLDPFVEPDLCVAHLSRPPVRDGQ
jgi:predicted ArsR family transcriptional regulator